ncbi:putative RNA polymerase II subunit B1 CTD phosphatase rpap2 [Salvelinus alpinus]|uniref:putative RNA polymerase II subunit B1 CTD phosphatase rpap2 n=1 Tax=Salvelinus alpinus TaxID=8036 RepID=UPI0039FD4256
MKFLYGPDHFNKTTVETKKKEEEEEELDEDNLEDVVEGVGDGGDGGSPGGPWRPSAPSPDYNTIRRDTEELELSVREFYKGVRETGPETQSLRNIVGSLHLTMTDISSDLNNLVRTFRLSEVSPVYRRP